MLFFRNKRPELLFLPESKSGRFGHIMQNFIRKNGNYQLDDKYNKQSFDMLYLFLYDIYYYSYMFLNRPLQKEKKENFIKLLTEIYDLIYGDKREGEDMIKLRRVDEMINNYLGTSQMTYIELYNEQNMITGGRNKSIFMIFFFVVIAAVIIIFILFLVGKRQNKSKFLSQKGQKS